MTQLSRSAHLSERSPYGERVDGGTDEKRMRLRYAGTCRVCGVQLPARAEAIYERATKTVRCVSHDVSTPIEPRCRWESSTPLSWTSLTPARRERQRVASSSGARPSVKNASGPSTRNSGA